MKIGEKIRRLRVLNNLTQEELASRCELSKGFISQVEREFTSPSIATLLDILESLGTNLQEFFSEDVPEQIVFKRTDAFIKSNDELGHEVHWIVPNAQKNLMEPIILNLKPGGRSELEHPHEGEEFGYVLKGAISIFLGKEKFRAKLGECFYYKPSVSHYILNSGKSPASVLWLVTPPSF